MFSFSCTKEKNKEVPFSMAIEMGNSCTRVFPNTRTWEQQEGNETDEEGKKRGVSMEKSKALAKERIPDSVWVITYSKCNNKQNIILQDMEKTVKFN